jgi:hypothetical protein
VTRHELKCWPDQFEAVVNGTKTFELRRDDRGFRVGDELLLRCWDPDGGAYTGTTVTAEVTHILRGAEALRFGLRPGYCVLSISVQYDEDVVLRSWRSSETRTYRLVEDELAVDAPGAVEHPPPTYGTPDAGAPAPTGVCGTCMGEQMLPQFTSDPVIRGDRIVQSGAELLPCPQCGGRERFGYNGPTTPPGRGA